MNTNNATETAKSAQNRHPKCNGYTTETPNVLPTDATVDTPVVYKKVSVPEKQLETVQARPTSTV